MTIQPARLTLERKRGDFWLYWTGQSISRLGSALTNFAIPLLVYNLSGSARNLGLVLAATYLPYVLISVPVGAWIDRINRKTFMIAMDILRALVLVIVPSLILFGQLPIWWAYVVTLLNTIFTVGFNAASYSAVRSLVEPRNLVKANGLIQSSLWLSLVVGPLLATLLLARSSLHVVLWVDGGTYLLSALSLLLIRSHFQLTTPHPSTEPGFGHAILQGMRYLFSQPVLRSLTLLAFLINITTGTILAQQIFVAKQLFASTDAQAGLFATALGLGGALTTLSVGWLKRWFSYGLLLLGPLVLFGLLTVVLCFVPNYSSGVLVWGCMFAMIGFFDVLLPSIIQTITPPTMLGRVTSIILMIGFLTLSLSSAIGGLIIDRLHNLTLVFVALGIFMIVVTLAFVASPLSRIEQFMPDDSSQ